MTVDEAKRQLEGMGQGHVLKFLARLTGDERIRLLGQIAELDINQIRRMQAMLADRGGVVEQAIEPAPVLAVTEERSPAAFEAGQTALKQGRVGVVLVAGGQGSRLGFEGPKGCFPIAPVSQATLFEIHARKILGLERQCGAPIPFYIMTSVANDADTRRFFETHEYFGLTPDRVRFFQQGMWPAMDAEGRLILESPSSLFLSPDGHGGILAAMEKNGVFADLDRRGVDTLFYFQVDNPLVDIAAPGFIGLHHLRNAQMSLKVCAKRGPEEGLGVVVRRNGRFAMVEYTELTHEQKHARTPDNELLFNHGSVAIHVFSVDFLKAQARADLPLHLAHKKVPCCDENGNPVKPDKPNAFKFEKFIFDVLLSADRVVNLAFQREEEFSPVKNATGADSPETSRCDQSAKFARWLAAAGVHVPLSSEGLPVHRIEIDPCFALDARTLKARLPAGLSTAGDIHLV